MVPPSSYLCPWFNFDCSTCFAGVQSGAAGRGAVESHHPSPANQHVSSGSSGARRKDRIAPYPARASAALSLRFRRGVTTTNAGDYTYPHHVSRGIAACLADVAGDQQYPPVQLALVMGTSRRPFSGASASSHASERCVTPALTTIASAGASGR